MHDRLTDAARFGAAATQDDGDDMAAPRGIIHGLLWAAPAWLLVGALVWWAI